MTDQELCRTRALREQQKAPLRTGRRRLATCPPGLALRNPGPGRDYAAFACSHCDTLVLEYPPDREDVVSNATGNVGCRSVPRFLPAVASYNAGDMFIRGHRINK